MDDRMIEKNTLCDKTEKQDMDSVDTSASAEPAETHIEEPETAETIQKENADPGKDSSEAEKQEVSEEKNSDEKEQKASEENSQEPDEQEVSEEQSPDPDEPESLKERSGNGEKPHGEVIVVTSGKGGVGKTTVTANLGVGLSRQGSKVLVIDMDLGLRNLDVMLGMENKVLYNLVDVVEERCSASEALVASQNYENLRLLPAAQSRDKSAVTPEQMKALTDELRKDFDYILLDCPAGIEQGFQNAAAGADRAIIVTNPETYAVRDADRIKDLLAEHGIICPDLIINRVVPDLIRQGILLSKEDVDEVLGLPLLGIIPEDPAVMAANQKGMPLVGAENLPGQAFQNICHRLRGEDYPFLDLERKKKRRGWFWRLRHKN